eukprot:CAMPEP_0117069498 /NCGR_PEP_ID=MMETSP0472-20121206/48755_1 /TAXON_ID=693140 ORGANISM="Tiarina fusus, Strain LIS" /NCGR_SAMPLE_ID=MMETSP0472 /ASSEMBLY_ACC=CAM_ASM_000603 /LENGTH=136 /DNA_ID=CAMNT_0004792081 /DNA_START=61 /DNA_END=471 /DNA_ORIENTATION=-
MNLILHWTNHHYVEMMMNILRCIVVMELCQNAWSFSVVSQNSQGRDGATLLQRARRGQIAIPWRKTEDKKDEAHVWLEDEFLDEKGDESIAPDINYSVEVGRYDYEGDVTVDPVSVLTEGFDHGVLEEVDDEELAP